MTKHDYKHGRSRPPGESPELVMLSEPNGARAEAIRALRTYVAAQHVQAGRRALALCAPSAGAGCTFVAANLAVAFAQIGVRTLLIDADLRDPGVGKIIAPERLEVGLAQYLMSPDAVFVDVIEENRLPNLSVMYAGGAAANPQELLAAERFKALVDFCMRDYDLTIIDTPPANTCSDARRVSTVAGYSVVVTCRDQTFVDDVKTLVGHLRGDHAHVLGTVLTNA